MSRIANAGLPLAAVIAVLLLLGTVVPDAGRGGRAERGSGGGIPYFHAGKSVSSGSPKTSCRSESCHPPYPHGGKAGTSAFLNMHARFIECLACHGEGAGNRWAPLRTAASAEPGSAGARPGIGYRAPEGEREGGDRHVLLAPAISCRGCHSESGRNAMAARGIEGLASGFDNPIALRMIEEGGKRWIPADMR